MRKISVNFYYRGMFFIIYYEAAVLVEFVFIELPKPAQAGVYP